MPDDTPEKGRKCGSRDSKMEQVSATPLTFGMEETAREKPLAYAKYIVKYTKTFFGKYIYVVLFC